MFHWRKTVPAFLLVTAVACSAQATVLTMHTSLEFSGGTAPSGPAPWLTATFDDHGGAGSVTMTLSTTNLTGSEFISGWYLNINPALNVNSLVFSGPTKVGSFDLPAISTGEDGFKADGDGNYDILLGFATAGSGGGSHRFGVGDSVTYTITGIPTLTANSFDFGSTHAGGNGQYLMTAHVQGIGTGGSLSGWVAPGPNDVPEPATLALLAGGGLAMLRRKRR